MTADVDGRILSWNPTAESIFGIPADRAIGQPLAMLFTAEDLADGLPQYELLVGESHGAAEDDRWLVRADGSRFWATGVLTGLRDETGALVGYGKLVRNRTDLREQFETLRNEAAAAQIESHRKDVFLSTLSHELRNPLAPLTHAAQLIRLVAPGDPRLEPIVQIIERQLENLRRLVDDLLDLSRVGAGKIEINKTVVQLHDVIHRAVETTREIVRTRGHRLDVLLAEGAIRVEGDAARLEQVFVNLLNNAAKYTPEGGRIWIKGATEGDDAVVSVIDDGVGIPTEMLPRIFDLFTQVEAARPHAQGGLGIGLSLVKSLVSLHGGTVQVRSDGPGKGSEFVVRLPKLP